MQCVKLDHTMLQCGMMTFLSTRRASGVATSDEQSEVSDVMMVHAAYELCASVLDIELYNHSWTASAAASAMQLQDRGVAAASAFLLLISHIAESSGTVGTRRYSKFTAFLNSRTVRSNLHAAMIAAAQSGQYELGDRRGMLSTSEPRPLVGTGSISAMVLVGLRPVTTHGSLPDGATTDRVAA